MGATLVGQYLGYIVAGLLAMVMGWNRLRRDSSSTSLQEKTDHAAGTFVQDLIADHRRVVDQLREAHEDHAANAERVGALTAEVNILREQVGEVKDLLKTLGTKLDEANNLASKLEKDLIAKEAEVVRLIAERDNAIRERDLLKQKYES